MGNERSQMLTPEEMKDLKNNTAFSQQEIQDWFRKFHKDCPSGNMNLQEFKQLYAKLFPKGDASKFAEHVFQAYDEDNNGFIDFREFLCTVSVTSRGTVDQRLQWAFDMYDLDNSGYISDKEARDIIQVYNTFVLGVYI